jgi:hypothetical protein
MAHDLGLDDVVDHLTLIGDELDLLTPSPRRRVWGSRRC